MSKAPRFQKPKARATRARWGLLIVGLKDVEDVFGIAGNIPGPIAKAAVLVDGFDPLREKFPLSLILLRVLSLNFEDDDFSGGEANEIVRAESEHNPLVNVQDFKTQVVILHPPCDVGVAVKFKGFACLPAGIQYGQVDVSALRGFARPASEPRLHVARGADGALRVKDRAHGESILKANCLPNMLDDFRH